MHLILPFGFTSMLEGNWYVERPKENVEKWFKDKGIKIIILEIDDDYIIFKFQNKLDELSIISI